MPQSTVHLKVDMDGGIAVHSMQADIGQGSNTLLAAIVAEVLGVDLDRVHVQRVDSDVSPIDLGSYSSRVTFMMGNAARAAAEDLRGKIVEGAASLLGAPADSLEVGHERIHPIGRPDEGVSFDQALHRDRKSTRLNSSHGYQSRMPSSA